MQRTDLHDFTGEEQESFVNWDYASGRVVFYSTKKKTFDGLVKKTEKVEGVAVERESLTVSIPMKSAKKPASVVRTARAEGKKAPMTEKHLEALARGRERRRKAPLI
jgi:hypothetical protein